MCSTGIGTRSKLDETPTNIQDVSSMCRLCGESTETVMHLSSGCSVLAKTKYQIWHDIVGKPIQWLLLKKYGIPK